MTLLNIDRVRLGVLIIAALVLLPLGGCGGSGGSEQPPLSGTIAFMRGPAHSFNQIAAMKADGSGLRTVARGELWKSDSPLRWSPDGTKLVFTMLRPRWRSRLYVMNVDGTGLRRITGRKYEDDINPAWSPDGRRLVFDAEGDGWTDLCVVNVDGSGERTLAAGSYVTGDPAKVAGGDAWSPDGRKIAYIDRHGRLAVMKPEGSDRRRLHGAVFASANPSWSPNGRKIVFNADDEIAVVNADGTGRRSVAPRSSFPVWSPDGRKIVFVRSGGVFVVNSDGSGLRKVGRGGDRPSWSPDGRWVVYSSYRNRQGDIYIVKPDGSDERQLTDTALNEAGPVWSPVR